MNAALTALVHEVEGAEFLTVEQLLADVPA